MSGLGWEGLEREGLEQPCGGGGGGGLNDLGWEGLEWPSGEKDML